MFSPTNIQGGEATRRDTSRSPARLLDGSQRRAVVSEMRDRPADSDVGNHLARQAVIDGAKSQYSWVSQHSMATASGFGPAGQGARPAPGISGVTSILRDTGVFGRDGVRAPAGRHHRGSAYGTQTSMAHSIISKLPEAARNDGGLAPTIGLIADGPAALP